MTPERIREIAMEALAKRLERHAEPSSWTANFAIPTKELLEIIERLAPPEKDAPPTPQWRPMSTAPQDGRRVLLWKRDTSSESRHQLEIGYWWESVACAGNQSSSGRHGYWKGMHEAYYDGWFPIPGEDGPRP